MRTFKATYKDRKGRRRESSKWYVEFQDHNETTRRLPAFSDRQQSERFGRNVEELVACRLNGEKPDKELRKRLALLPAKLRDKLAKLGLLTAETVAAGKPLSDHVADFEAALRRKKNTADYVALTVGRVQALFDGCGFKAWSNMEGEAVDRWLESQRDEGLAVATSNYYLQAVRQFCRWMVRERRASESPLEHLGRLNAATDRRHDRRALSADEARRLLTAAQCGAESFGVPGTERRLLYLLALQSGLRANELRSLTRSSFDFRLRPPTVTIEAGSSKRRRRDTLPLRADTAAELQAHLATKHPGTPAFELPAKWDMADMLKADLDAARAAWLCEATTVEERAKREQSSFLAYVNESGEYADFHSLRHSFLTELARSGVHPKIAQALARHSTISLTLDRYSHTVLGEQGDAVESLPSFTGTVATEQRATGTHDTADIDRGSVLADCLAGRGAVKPATNEPASDATNAVVSGAGFVLASCLALSSEKLAVNADSTASESVLCGDEKTPENTAFSRVFAGEREVRLSGLEPETYGLKVRCSTN